MVGCYRIFYPGVSAGCRIPVGRCIHAGYPLLEESQVFQLLLLLPIIIAVFTKGEFL